jgi:hypothetical protein
MATEDEDPEALLATLHRMEMDDALEEIKAMSDDEVARAIEAEGGDPVAIGERGATLAAELLERRERLAWQADAAEKRERALARIAARPKGPRGTRAEMIERIKVASQELGLAIAARKGGAEAATDAQLEALLDEIEVLQALREEDDEV